ncbi:Ig-like domain-containing protein [Microbacterium sp. NPDC076911]|uniref:Ig-like domain-containing protein n=1 Tax=Microbacterium sp. NPDC076911 TaxID=3154958 RepID=UPI00343E0DCB
MRRSTTTGIVAASAVAAVVIGISVVWPGLDAQDTPEIDDAVWALQTGEGRRYARVNTVIDELDTVRDISNPDRVVQAPDAAYLFSDSLSKVTRIDEAQPIDLDEAALASATSTPAGTVFVVTAGDYVAYRTDSGNVFVGTLSSGTTTQLDPFLTDDETAPQYAADAIAVDERGLLFSYSSADAAVLLYDIAADDVRARDELTVEGLGAPLITAAGDQWALVDAEDGEVWLSGGERAVAATTGTVVVAAPDAGADAIYLADETSLIAVPTDGSEVTTLVGDGTTVRGIPATPVSRDGALYAAWLGQADTGGVLWTRGVGDVLLDYGGESLPDQRRPVFVLGERTAILNDTRSGWAWNVFTGELLASSQDWSLDDRTDPEAVPSDEEREVVLDPKPPIAEPDAFGVRTGRLVTLPVLMNDHDPNEDVLTIVPDSIIGLDETFGTVRITDDGQRLVVSVAPGANGSADFTYAVQDGTAPDGLRSEPTAVTLTVHSESENTAPQWCGVEGCLLEWPQPEVARGGTVTVPVLPGWVDPDGDPLLLLAVENPSQVGSVAATPAGDVVYQHSDSGGGSEELVELTVTVADTAGEQTERALAIRVSPQPQLTVQSFSTIDLAGGRTTIDVAAHVTGTTGALSLESVRVLDDANATATAVGGTTQFDFTAADPGTYRVDFTVTDGQSDETGTALITLVPADAPAELSTSPVVAFVYPQEDATLDVFTAVSNPTRRVLLLSDAVATAEPGAQLSVDAVGQNNLRVSGTTATGAAGRLGTVSYVVSDGTEDAGARIEGEATVYLLPPAPELAPIAVDDSVVVRAGGQIDIPVLENDIAPSGGAPTLNPASVVSSASDALAFASGETLRYLAPTTPGDYTIDYEAFSTGAPSLADTATVRVRVLSADTNRAPVPETLEGRVLSGQTVAIDFDDFGMDPDGDTVTLERIVTQPERGAATIAADGRSILYSSVTGDRGQATFRYQVVDEFGEQAEGTARIGVLDAQSNPSPVTFSDYVQVQAGEGNQIRISPLANDIDPTNGTLTLTAVRPDLPAQFADGTDNPEYARLDGLVESMDDSTIVLNAGTDPGTKSYLYDLESDSGNTARGLIVVRVVRESVPDFPVVDDTVLTVETREDFESGVDVLSGKVAWSGGDIGDLELSLWQDPTDVDVNGRMLSGDLPARSRLIPFAVTGEGTSGEMTTYAFLRVPGDEDLALSLRAGTPPLEVTELESLTFDMAELVAVPRGATLQVSPSVTVSGARGEASCAHGGATSVTYDAGVGAPWTDACVVPVRLEGQEDWTYLSVPVVIQALDPQPVLKAGSMTVGPGETASFDLRDLTSWQLREDWNSIEYSVDYSGAAFVVTQSGSEVFVTGRDAAVPGTEEAAAVAVVSHPSVSAVRLIMRVGAAPSTLPQGGSVTQQCSQSNGSSCTFDVIGASGEVNPLPGTPLEVEAVRGTGACVGVTFTVASLTSVTASWTDEAPGATCAATFSVSDAQGRVTSAQRDGRLLLDLLGFPKAPASVVQSAYESGSVTLRVDPGDARLAYPALTGFIVRVDGETVARCAANGTCGAIPAVNGQKRTYVATAVSDVGESHSSVRTIAWAYDPPAAPTKVTGTPVVTAGEGGAVSLVIDGIDSDQTGSLEITSATGETVRVPVARNQSTVEVSSYRVATNVATSVTVTPFSRFEIPNGLPGSSSGLSARVTTNGIGAPRNVQLALTATSQSDGTATIEARVSATANGTGSTLRYGVVPQGQTCTVGTAGPVVVFTGVATGDSHSFTACVESYRNEISYGRTEAQQTVRAYQDRTAPQNWSFVVDATPNVASQRAEWIIRDQPTTTEDIPRRTHAEFSGGPSTSIFGQDPGMRVRYVHDDWQDWSTPWATVSPRAGSAPYQLQVSWNITSCVGGSELRTAWDSSKAPNGSEANVTFGNSTVRYYDASGALLAHAANTWTVPVGAVLVEGVSVSAGWSAQGWGLSPASSTLSATCDPNLPITPEPTP